MENTAVDPPLRLTGGGEVEAKKELEQRRNRRALGDIGNLEVVRAVEGKSQLQISRPITRGFQAQLLVNAQVAVEKKKDPVELVKKKPISVKEAAKAQGKKINKPKPEDVVVISSDEKEDKFNNKSDGGSVQKPQRKEVKTLTSILTARSKAACGVKDEIVNIDVGDADIELAVSEYVEDMYEFYRLAEDENRVHDYMDSQRNINAKMRSILIDWLIDVHRKFELMPETLYLNINIIDRYLSLKRVSRKNLQLVGISATLIACKYEEIWPPQVNDFVCISDYAYTGDQILVMEKAILGKLEWYLTVPTPYVFLVRYIKASLTPDIEMENMPFFLAELGMMNYQTIISYGPSMIAAAAVYAARRILKRIPLWSKTLKHQTDYSEEQLMSCAELLVGFHSTAGADNKLRAVYRKFLDASKGAVALITPAKSLEAKLT